MPSPSPDLPGRQALAQQLVVFTGKLSSLRRSDARALVVRLGGSTAEDVTVKTTMVVVGSEGLGASSETVEDDSSTSGSARTDPAERREKSKKVRRAEELNAQGVAAITVVGEDEFCRIAGVPTPESLRRQYHAVRDLLARYRWLRDDHLRYLVKCGIIRPVLRTNADTFFAFRDVAAIKQVNDELARGTSFQSVARALVSTRQGQLTLDFRLEAAPAKIIVLPRPHDGPLEPPRGSGATQERDRVQAEEYFRAGSYLDNGDETKQEEAAAAYRRALELDPYLVAATINLANIHYSRDELVEAQALYERAIGLESDFFEAHFNLGNIYHDLGRFPEAQGCYQQALRLNPFYADAHFYLAVTFEKMGLSPEARPHWRAYQQLAPQGEWVELAREFSE